MSRAWRHWWPLYALTLPLSIIAIGYALVVGGHAWRWQDGCLTFLSSRMIGQPGGQCWSPVIGFASEAQRARRDLQVHERVHVVQCFCLTLGALGLLPVLLVAIGAPLWLAPALAWLAFPIAYGAGFAYGWALTRKGWREAYHRSPFEIAAYARQDAYVVMPPSKQIHVWGHR